MISAVQDIIERKMSGEESWNNTGNYFPIKVSSLIVGAPLQFDIHFPIVEHAKGLTWKILASKGQICNREFRESLLNRNIGSVYVYKAEQANLQDYFAQCLEKAVLDKNMPMDERIQLVCDGAEYLVRKVLMERPTAGDVAHGRLFTEAFSSLLTANEISGETICSTFSKQYHITSHSVQVAALGMGLCRFLNWSKEEISDWGLGALFHDIGKGSNEEKLLEERTRLTLEEFEVMKVHTTVGHLRLKSLGAMSEDQLDIVLSHHEAADGTGYPAGLKGYRIHKYARIARIIDCYDSLSTKKPHKTALSSGRSIRVMQNDLKSTFDSQLLEAFINFMGMGDEMSESAEGKRINIELGSELLIQFEDADVRFKTALVGMELGEYLILRSPDPFHIRNQIYEGRRIIARCMHSGNVYGFRSDIVCHVLHPSLRLLILSYPKKIEAVNLRKSQRVDCYIPAEGKSGDHSYRGVIVDLSAGGCRFMVKRANVGGTTGIQIDQGITLQAQLLGEERAESISGVVRNLKVDGDRITGGIQFVNTDERTKNNLDKFIGNIMKMLE